MFKKYTGFIVLILVPSRELAVQIQTVVKSLVQNTVGVRTALLIGGESREQQVYRLQQNVNVLIGTPGRITDLLQYQPALSIFVFFSHYHYHYQTHSHSLISEWSTCKSTSFGLGRS